MKNTYPEYLCENSSTSTTVVRKRLIKHKVFPYVCSVCGQEPFWNGRMMPLILDHINGISNDHRLENLRWVCGNCNLQLETNCGRNRVKGKIDWPSYEVLEEMVKSQGVSQTARNLGASRAAVRYRISIK